MKRFVLLSQFLLANVLFAQESINVSGGTTTNSNGSFSFSIGQVNYIATSSLNGNISQGVQQAFEIYVLSIETPSAPSYQMSVFPNPAVLDVSLAIKNVQFDVITFQLYDSNGKQVRTQKINSEITQIAMEQLASGIYLLQVFENNTLIKSFKIIKK